MTQPFAFTRVHRPDVATHTFLLPPPPYGTSHSVARSIEAYVDAIINAESDEIELAAAAEVAAYEPSCLQDAIAKAQIALHRSFCGLDGEDDTLLLIASNEADLASILHAQAMLAELYQLIPCDWTTALSEAVAAAVAEGDFDERIWLPAYEIHQASGARMPEKVEAEMERLSNIRDLAENVLLDMPPANLEQWAVKYLICFGNDRDLNGYEDQLVAEAEALLGLPKGAGKSGIAGMMKAIGDRSLAHA